MTKSRFKNLTARVLAWVLPGLLAALVAACGGGGDDGPPTSGSPLVVSGLAATGAPMANSLVSVKCTAGAVVSGLTAADGTFRLVLQGGQVLPCLVKVTRGDPEVTLYSLATAAGHVNVTPLTDLALARALGAAPAGAFAQFGPGAGADLQGALTAAKAYMNAQILAITGQSPSADLFTGVFQIGGADDQILDALGQTLAAAKMDVDDLHEAAAQGGDLKASILAHEEEEEEEEEEED